MALDVLVNDTWMKLETCFTCKTPFVMSAEVYTVADQLKEKFSFYCPHGHGQYYCTGESEKAKLQRLLNNANQQIARAEDEAREAHAEAERERRAKKRLEKRIHAGVCPCCNRTFVNLQRHMASKHPSNVVPLKVKS